MMAFLGRMMRDGRAASAAEFALVLPLFLVLTLGMIDVGRLVWTLNQAEKATQIGARMAIVTNPVSPGLIEADFASGTLPAGALIPASSLGKVSCISTGCSCTGTCPTGMATTVDSTSFTRVVNRMAEIMPGITATNVQIDYKGSGFGYAGSPVTGGGGGAAETMEISPLVTVSITGVPFEPLSTLRVLRLTLPSYSSTLPAEDASGQYSN